MAGIRRAILHLFVGHEGQQGDAETVDPASRRDQASPPEHKQRRRSGRGVDEVKAHIFPADETPKLDLFIIVVVRAYGRERPRWMLSSVTAKEKEASFSNNIAWAAPNA